MILIKFKLYYLFFYIFPALLTYINIYFKSIGISATQIGLMNSTARALAILILPVWGMLADYFGANKKVLMMALGGTCLFMVSFLFTETYIWIFVLFIFYTIFRSPSPSLSDALVLNYLKEKSNEYGKYRVWGSAGYMLAVTPFGFLIEQTQPRILFFLAGAVLFITLVIASRLPPSEKTIEVASLSDFKILLKNKALFRFLLLIFLLQIPLRSYFIYFPILFKASGGGETLLGVSMLIASASELIIFQKSDKFFDILSIKKLFILNAFIFGLRWLIVAVFTTPNILILSQLLHGITFGLLHVTTVYYISQLVGESFEASGQNLYASTISIATVVSSFLGGIIYDQLGGENLFLFLSIIAFLAGIGCYLNIFITPEKAGN